MTTTSSEQKYFTIAQAARRIGSSPDALRRRCERAATKLLNGNIVAELGGGIRAFKFGRTWLVTFPE
jgi:hypothetical protein